MWWLLKVVVFVALLVVMVLVAVQNDAVVTVNILSWEFVDVRVFLVMLVSAIFGLACGLAFAAVREIQWRLHRSRHEREKGDLRREVDHLRKAPLKGLDETRAVGDPARPKD